MKRNRIMIAFAFAGTACWVFVVLYGWYVYIAVGIWGARDRPMILNSVIGDALFWLGFGLACLVAFGGGAFIFMIADKEDKKNNK